MRLPRFNFDPNGPTSLWAFTRWLELGLRRLLHQTGGLALALIAVLVIALLIPADSVSDAAALVALASGLLMALAGTALGLAFRRLATPVAVALVLYLGFAVVSALSDDSMLFGFVGIAMGLWLLTLVEFGLRGAGRTGLTGESAVQSRLDEADDSERYGWRLPAGEGRAPLLSAYAGLFLAVVTVVLTWAY